jgi:DNA-binding ferritin-like protein
MHRLDTIKDACAEALQSDGAQANANFRAVADPASVMEMASAIESLLTYMEKIDDLAAQELVREIRHRVQGAGPEGGV